MQVHAKLLIHDGRSSAFLSASRAAPWTARQGVGSQAEPVALVAECSIPVT